MTWLSPQAEQDMILAQLLAQQHRCASCGRSLAESSRCGLTTAEGWRIVCARCGSGLNVLLAMQKRL